MKNILIISNGHGEDIIGAVLARELIALGYGVQALPLVGKGTAYRSMGVEPLGPCQEMPSGGFVIDRPVAFWDDLKAGWLTMSLAHYKAVRRAAGRAVATLVVGDIYGILVGSVFGKGPLFLMQCYVSVRVWQSDGFRQPYGALERFLMSRAVGVYPREAEGADWLRRNGVPNAEYLGNPMLDALEGVPIEVEPPYLLLLPGSRSDAYQSLPRMLEASRQLKSLGLTPVVAWAGLPLPAVEGWHLQDTGAKEGLTHLFAHPDGTVVHLTQKAFKTVLLGSWAAISTSGTAAEQAAGYGVPVVAFPTGGPQYTLTFAQRQKRLLGDALLLTEPDPEAISRGVREFLSSEELRQKARAAGKAAMGEPGAARRIAWKIHSRLKLQ